MNVPLLLTPASVSVVTRALSEEQNAVTVSDALRNTSGVNVQSNFGQHDYFVVRGFDSLSAGLVLTDGLAEPEATFYNLYNVERVEVLKGPGGFLYGANAMAGTVNLLRLKPTKDSFWGAEVGGGSFDTYNAAFDANFGGDAVRFRLNGLWRESDGFRDGRDSEIVGFNPVLDFTLGDNELPPLRRRGSAQRGGPRRRSPDLRRRELRPAARALLPVAVRLLGAGRHAPAPALGDAPGWSWTIRNRAYWTELDWQSEGTLLNGVFPFFPGPDGLFVARTLVPLDDDQTLAGRRARGPARRREAQLAVRGRGRGAQRRVHHRPRPAPVHQPVQSGRDRDLAAARRFPASARRGTPSGRSSRRT